MGTIKRGVSLYSYQNETFQGKMTLEDVVRFEPLFADGSLAEPRWLPPWVERASGLAGMLAFSLFANRIRMDRLGDGPG